MPFEIRPFPDFAWSASRDRAFSECERLWYYLSYGSHNGWLSAAPPIARSAYALKQLTTLPMALGQAIHRRAREAAEAVRAGHPIPDRASMVQRTRAELNALVLSSRDGAAFLASPKHHPMLHELYYGIGLPRWRTDRIAEKLERCLAALCAAQVWSELRSCPPSDVLLPDMPSSYLLHGVTVYAAPDLVYRSGDLWTLVEWKTSVDEDALEQLGVYALYLEHSLHIPFEEGAYRGLVVNLDADTTESVVFTRSNLDAAASHVRQSVARMRGLLVDPEANVPKPKMLFRLARNPARCPRCNFFELCATALGYAASPDQPHDTAADATSPDSVETDSDGDTTMNGEPWRERP